METDKQFDVVLDTVFSIGGWVTLDGADEELELVLAAVGKMEPGWSMRSMTFGKGD